MVEIIQKAKSIKLQEEVCPHCGDKLDEDGNCPTCSPKETETEEEDSANLSFDEEGEEE